MNSRIRELRKILNLNQKDFAKKIGLKQGAISYMEKNGSTITEQNIKNICSQFNVNEKWLRTGLGDIFIENEKKYNELFNIFEELSPVLQDYLIKTAKDLLDIQEKNQLNANARQVSKSYNFSHSDNESDNELTVAQKRAIVNRELDDEEKSKSNTDINAKRELS